PTRARSHDARDRASSVDRGACGPHHRDERGCDHRKRHARRAARARRTLRAALPTAVQRMSAAERALTDLWSGKGSAAALWLQPLASLYGAVTAARRGLYASGVLPSYKVGRPVVVVGNLTVGGTGKTPLVAWLAEKLVERGLAVGIVSRGYG